MQKGNKSNYLNTDRISVYSERVYHENGDSFTHVTVETPDGVAVLPIDGDGNIVLVKQYRPSIDEVIYEIPAGGMKPGEKPEETAVRELMEETGYAAVKMVEAGDVYTSPGFVNETLHLYVAAVEKKCEPKLESDEILQVQVIPLEEAFELIRQGRIPDTKTQLMIIKYYMSQLLKGEIKHAQY